MAKYIRDYKVTFLVDRDGNNKLVYTSIDKANPLHVTFSVRYEVGKPESKMELSIYNMSAASRKLLQAEDVKVLLEVGTRNTEDDTIITNTLFIGTVSEPLSTNTTNSDHVTRIKATSGYDIKEIQLSNRIQGKVTKLKVIETICRDISEKSYGMINYDLSYLQEGKGSSNATRSKLMEDLKEVYRDGYSYEGTAIKCLDDVIRNFSLEATMRNNGTIKLHKQNHSEGIQIFEVGIDNGLLTVPQPVANKHGQAQSDPRTAKGYSFKSLLIPQINVNDRVRIKHPSVDLKDDLIVQAVKFSGGYEASHWYSTVKAHFESDEDAERNIAEYKLSSQQDINYYNLLTGG